MEKIVWSPKIRQAKIRQLYQNDALGAIDETLVEAGMSNAQLWLGNYCGTMARILETQGTTGCCSDAGDRDLSA